MLLPRTNAGSTTTDWFPTHNPSKHTSELPSTALKAWGGCQPQQPCPWPPQTMCSELSTPQGTWPHKGNEGTRQEEGGGLAAPSKPSGCQTEQGQSHEADSPGTDWVWGYRVGSGATQEGAGAQTNPPFPHIPTLRFPLSQPAAATQGQAPSSPLCSTPIKSSSVRHAGHTTKLHGKEMLWSQGPAAVPQWWSDSSYEGLPKRVFTGTCSSS